MLNNKEMVNIVETKCLASGNSSKFCKLAAEKIISNSGQVKNNKWEFDHKDYMIYDMPKGLTGSLEEDWLVDIEEQYQICVKNGGDEWNCAEASTRYVNALGKYQTAQTEFNKTINNVSATLNAKTRKELFDGKQHIVAPVVLLVEGVHHGTAGPLLYLDEELTKFAAAWNGITVTNGHPATGINDPGAFDEYSVGKLWNTEFKENKLKSEIWVDINKANSVNPKIVVMLESDKIMEVSTGLFTEDEYTSGKYNGDEYIAIARNYRPDHLALLPDDIGACSVTDGCGVRENKSFTSERKKYNIDKDKMKDKIMSQDNETTQNDSEIDEKEVTNLVTKFVNFIKNSDKEKEMSTDNKEKVDAIISNSGNEFAEEDRDWLTTLKDTQLDKFALATNEEKTETKESVANTETKEPVDNSDVSVEEFIASAPTGEVKDFLNSAVKLHKDKKDVIVDGLMQNKRNTFNKEQLSVKSLAELESIQNLATVTSDYTANAGSVDTVQNHKEEPLGLPVLEEKE